MVECWYIESSCLQAIRLGSKCGGRPVKLPWEFLGASLNINGAPRNIQGDLTALWRLSANVVFVSANCDVMNKCGIMIWFMTCRAMLMQFCDFTELFSVVGPWFRKSFLSWCQSGRFPWNSSLSCMTSGSVVCAPMLIPISVFKGHHCHCNSSL